MMDTLYMPVDVPPMDSVRVTLTAASRCFWEALAYSLSPRSVLSLTSMPVATSVMEKPE